VVLPVVSYHLDFDVCFRARGSNLLAFVNDTLSAARLVVTLGLEALEREGALDRGAAQTVRADFSAGRDLEAVRRLSSAMQRQLQGRREFPASLSKHFVTGRVDSAAGNLQCFCSRSICSKARARARIPAM
jgi:hypothetical protein